MKRKLEQENLMGKERLTKKELKQVVGGRFLIVCSSEPTPKDRGKVGL